MKKQTVENQARFSRFLGLLLIYANSCEGYEACLKDVYRDPRCPYGIKRSYHHMALAGDIDLFYNGKWLTDSKDYKFLGTYWKSLSSKCTWGGDFKKKDGRHFSYLEGK